MSKDKDTVKLSEAYINMVTETFDSTGGPYKMAQLKKKMDQSTPSNEYTPTKQLIDMIMQIIKMKDNFQSITSKLPKDKWNLIEKDCDSVLQHLENAYGRISTIIHKSRV